LHRCSATSILPVSLSCSSLVGRKKANPVERQGRMGTCAHRPRRSSCSPTRPDGQAIAADGYPPVKRSSMVLATSSQTAAKSRSSCLPKTFSVFSASCRYITASCRRKSSQSMLAIARRPLLMAQGDKDGFARKSVSEHHHLQPLSDLPQQDT